MKKIILIIFFVFFIQKTSAQVASYNTLYILFEPDSTQTNSVQKKVIDALAENIDGTLREEDAYTYRGKRSNQNIYGFYPFMFKTINRNSFITIPLSQLSNYPMKTVDQVRAEANPSGAWYFDNYAFFDPIKHYYIVEKNIPAGTAKIVKVIKIDPVRE